MTSRDAILNRIRTALANDPPRERPPVPEVWPRLQPSAEEMSARFVQELQAVSGEAFLCRSIDDARRRVAELAQREGWQPIGCLDRPLCRDVVAGLPPDHVRYPGPEDGARSLADLAVGVIEADTLLADTGSAMIACAKPQERLMCYLPPVCIVAARASQLVEHVPAAWEKLAPRIADPALRGEFVFITGPSRTADIEKILILGVHGPKRLIVLVIAE